MKKILLFALGLIFAFPALAAPPLGNPIVSQQSAAAEGSHIMKASSGWLYGFDTTAGASAGYIMVIDSATVPADGAVTPRFCFAIPAGTTTGATWLGYPVFFANGIVMVFSTTGCFTKTISNTAFFAAQVQ